MCNALTIIDKGLFDITKQSSLVACDLLLATITRHSGYVGPDGKASTSKAGLSIQINLKIKKVFGKPVDQIKDAYEIKILESVRFKITHVINNGEANDLTRKQIKNNIYHAIESVYNAMK